MSRAWLIGGLSLALTMSSVPALAADSEVEQLRKQLRDATLRVRELQDQLASAPAATAAPPPAAAGPKPAPAASDAQLRALRAKAAQAGRLEAELAKAKAENETLTKAATDRAAELAKATALLNMAADQQRDLATDREQLKLQLAGMTRAAVTCQAKNARLVAFADSLLTEYGRIGAGQILASREPFIGLARVKLENLVQDREEAVRADRCNQRLDSAAPAPPQPAPAAVKPTAKP